MRTNNLRKVICCNYLIPSVNNGNSSTCLKDYLDTAFEGLISVLFCPLFSCYLDVLRAKRKRSQNAKNKCYYDISKDQLVKESLLSLHL